jgi:hypothetical protein
VRRNASGQLYVVISRQVRTEGTSALVCDSMPDRDGHWKGATYAYAFDPRVVRLHVP